MNVISSDRSTRKLSLSLRPDTCQVADPDFVARLRRIPRVLRVAVDADMRVVTLWFAEPAEGLLAEVHGAIKSHGCEIAAGRMR